MLSFGSLSVWISILLAYIKKVRRRNRGFNLRYNQQYRVGRHMQWLNLLKRIFVSLLLFKPFKFAEQDCALVWGPAIWKLSMVPSKKPFRWAVPQLNVRPIVTNSLCSPLHVAMIMTTETNILKTVYLVVWSLFAKYCSIGKQLRVDR